MYPPGPNDLALVASMALWGAVVGQLTFGFFADFVGTYAAAPPTLPTQQTHNETQTHARKLTSTRAFGLDRAQAHLCDNTRAHNRRRHRLCGERADTRL